jgi:type IV conjugative transfer system coupling protein TraD
MSLIRGSELLRHRWRMFLATLVFAFLLGLACGGLSLWLNPPMIDSGAWQVYHAYWLARLAVSIGLTHVVLPVPTAEGEQRWSVVQISDNAEVKQIADDANHILMNSAQQSMNAAALSAGLWFVIAGIYSHLSWRDQSVAGSRIEPRIMFRARQWLTAWLWSPYRLGGIRLVKDGERLHILIVGSTGTGKTTAILELLDQIRARGDTAVVYDPDGTFLSYFYRGDHDVVLNVCDARMPPWNPWADCLEPQHLMDLADAMMAREPSEGGDSIWDVGAAHFIAAGLEQLRRNGRTTNRDLYELLVTMPLNEIEERLKGTPAGVVMSKSIERTALSVRFTAMKRAGVFRYLQDASDGDAFSIRRFVSEPCGRWLFLSARADMRALLRPMLTVWFHVATTALLSLPPSSSRRLWFVVDEAASLNRLPALSTLLQEGRRFGACVVLGLQSLSQLASLYGDQEAITLLALPQTTLALRTPEPRTAELLAKRIGQQVFNECRESVQYGGHAARDGVSLSEHYTTRYLIEPAALQCLPDRVGYLKLPGPQPLVRVSLRVKERSPIAPPLIPRSMQVGRTDAKPTVSNQGSAGAASNDGATGLQQLADELTT